jgi:hypothetical protein
VTREIGRDADPTPSVFGFRVRSSLPLRFLRSGGGHQDIEVVEVAEAPPPSGESLGSWQLHGTAYPATASLFVNAGRYEYIASDAGRFLVDVESGRLEVPAMQDPLLREQRLYGMPMLLAFGTRGDLSLHAAAVEIEGGAVVIAAPSRFGKTTLSHAFHQRGFRLLAEDLVCITHDLRSVRPGPTMIRLRPDVFAASAVSGAEVVEERPDRVFLRITRDRAGSGDPVPLLGLFFLREAADVSVTKVDPISAVRDLWHLGYRHPTPVGRTESFRLLSKLAGETRIWDLHRPMDFRALDRTVGAVVETAGRG